MNTLEVLNKMDESLDFAIKSAELKLKGLEQNTEDYFRTEGEISGMNAAKALLHLTRLLCS